MQYVALVAVYLFYSSLALLLKYAGLQEPLSLTWFIGLAGQIVGLGIYALAWQQILKQVDLGTAYMFKGVSLIFIMLLLHFFYGEPITLMKLIGTGIIIVGIGLYAKA